MDSNQLQSFIENGSLLFLEFTFTLSNRLCIFPRVPSANDTTLMGKCVWITAGIWQADPLLIDKESHLNGYKHAASTDISFRH